MQVKEIGLERLSDPGQPELWAHVWEVSFGDEKRSGVFRCYLSRERIFQNDDDNIGVIGLDDDRWHLAIASKVPATLDQAERIANRLRPGVLFVAALKRSASNTVDLWELQDRNLADTIR